MDHGPARKRDALAIAFTCLFPLVMAYLYFIVLDNPEAQSDRTFQVAFGLGKLVQFAFPVLYVAWFERHELRIARPTSNGLILAVAFGFAVAAAMFGLYYGGIRDIPAVRDETPAKIWSKVQQFGMATPLGYLGIAVVISSFHSLAEEYYWRWFVFGRLRRHVPLLPAAVLSGLAFMLHHIIILGVYFPSNFWTLAIPFSLCVAFGGGVWACIYDRSGSLYAPWLCHALIDAAIMGVGYVMLEAYWS